MIFGVIWVSDHPTKFIYADNLELFFSKLIASTTRYKNVIYIKEVVQQLNRNSGNGRFQREEMSPKYT